MTTGWLFCTGTNSEQGIATLGSVETEGDFAALIDEHVDSWGHSHVETIHFMIEGGYDWNVCLENEWMRIEEYSKIPTFLVQDYELEAEGITVQKHAKEFLTSQRGSRQIGQQGRVKV